MLKLLDFAQYDEYSMIYFLLLDIDLDRKWSSTFFVGRTVNQEMLEPLDLGEHREDKRWSSIIFVERTFGKETPKPSNLVEHGEYSKT